MNIQPHNCAQVILDREVADPRYVASFFNSAMGRTVRELGGATHKTIPQLSQREVSELVVFLPAKEAQLRVIETDSRASSLLSEVSELREKLWQQPLQERNVRAALDGVNRNEGFSIWLDTLPFPLASILWAFHAAEGDDHKQYAHLDHFFEALAEFLATFALSAFRTSEALFVREWPTIRDTLTTNGLSIQRATTGTWNVIAERLFKRARTMLSGEQLDECLRAFRIGDRAVLDTLLNKNLVSAIRHANTLRNDWRGHGGVVGDRTAYERRVELVNLLDEVREQLGTVWTRYRLVRGGKMELLDNGIYKIQLETIMGRSYPFRSVTVELEQPLTSGQLYFLGDDEPQALQLLPFISLRSGPGDVQNACYFFNRIEAEEVRLVSYHFEPTPQLTGDFSEMRSLVDELSASS